MPVEVEIKLRIDDESTVAKIKNLPDVTTRRLCEWTDKRMLSLYYDTAGHDMLERKWTLRLRREDGVPVAAFKTPGIVDDALFTRDEWQCRAASIEESIPLLVESGAPAELLCMGPFVERCSVDYTRSATQLKLPDDSVIELAVDRGVISAGHKTERLLELELELLAGDPSGMVAFADKLREDCRLSREFSSKYIRALRLIRSR